MLIQIVSCKQVKLYDSLDKIMKHDAKTIKIFLIDPDTIILPNDITMVMYEGF